VRLPISLENKPPPALAEARRAAVCRVPEPPPGRAGGRCGQRRFRIGCGAVHLPPSLLCVAGLWTPPGTSTPVSWTPPEMRTRSHAKAGQGASTRRSGNGLPTASRAVDREDQVFLCCVRRVVLVVGVAAALRVVRVPFAVASDGAHRMPCQASVPGVGMDGIFHAPPRTPGRRSPRFHRHR
jgi:hypothetical protein